MMGLFEQYQFEIICSICKGLKSRVHEQW
uniref:Uncharacterized protein n=1 Tax=Arundo donax TaxID=35708 RepID=A0A0A9BD02_ARUDO